CSNPFGARRAIPYPTRLPDLAVASELVERGMCRRSRSAGVRSQALPADMGLIPGRYRWSAARMLALAISVDPGRMRLPSVRLAWVLGMPMPGSLRNRAPAYRVGRGAGQVRPERRGWW